MQDNMSFFILAGNQQQGPYTLAELRSRNITSATLVWAEGMAQWTPAWQVEALQPLFNGTPQGGAPVPPVPQQAQQTQQAPTGADAPSGADTPQTGQPPVGQHAPTGGNGGGNGGAEPQRHLLRGGCMAAVVVAVLMAVGLVATCPTPQDHREAVTRTLNRVVEHATAQGNDDAWGMIGSMITKRLVGVVVDQMLDVQNYGLWSVGTIHYKDTDKRVSFGILGHVYTFDADDIERALKQGGDQGGDTFHSPLYNPGSGSSADDGSSAEGQEDAPSYNAPDSPSDDTPQSPDDQGDDGTTDDSSADL